jgi:predicted transcriptional regulator/nucleotide-binding universal stress UspA family protein
MENTLYKRLLVALDGSPSSWQALQVGLQIAQSLGATLHVVSIVENAKAPPMVGTLLDGTDGLSGLRWDWATYLGKTQALALAQAELAGVPIETSIREGYVSSALVAVARENESDLLILGATGHDRPWSPTTGETALRVANEAPCAVMIVRPATSMRKVRDLMSREIATVTPETPLPAVFSRLVEQGVKLLIVVNEQQKVVGVITLGSLLTRDHAYRRLDLQHVASADLLLQYLRQFFKAEKMAKEVMIKQVHVVKDEVSVEQAVRWMISQHVTRVPVVNAGGMLVGVLDQESLLRYYSGFTDTTDGPEMSLVLEGIPPATPPRTVGEATIEKVPLVALETPLLEILQQVQSTRLRRVIVTNQSGRAQGVIADRDILASRGLMNRRNPVLAFAGRFSLYFPEEVFRRRLSSGPLTAQQVMRPQLYAVTPSTSVAEAVRLMLAHQIKHLVVVDEHKRPLGMVNRQQLLRSFVEGDALPDEEK